jgi:hypothetical protein
MPDIKMVALICVDCGLTLMRHPTMRDRRVVCVACYKVRRKEARKVRSSSELVVPLEGVER